MNKFDNINTLKKEFETLNISDHDRRRLDEKFRLEFSYNSNHLEGNTITYLDTKALLLKDIVANSYTFREMEEMKAHDTALALVKEWAVSRDRDISQVDIKELNKLILVKDFWKDAQTPDGLPVRRIIKVGEYKKCQIQLDWQMVKFSIMLNLLKYPPKCRNYWIGTMIKNRVYIR